MMDKTQRYDLTTGGILSKLLVISLPVMATQLIQMAYNLIDMFWLGHLSPGAVAASGTAGMFMWLSVGPMMFGRMGAEIGVSQNIGMGDRDTAQRFSQNALLLSLLFGIVYGGILVIFNKPLIGFFNIAETEISSAASSYLAIIGLGIPFTYIVSSLSGSWSGSGNSRVPFYINAVGLAFNMILDPIFILTLGMGVEGAAIATVIGQVIACVLSLCATLLLKSRPFETFKLFVKPCRDTVLRILKWGAPVCAESMLFCFMSMIISRFIAAWGADVIAAQKVGSQIESLAWLVGGGFGTALTSYIGQNYGAGKWTRIHRGFKISVLLVAVWGLMITCVIFFGGRTLAMIFINDPAIADITAGYLRILAACELIYCMEVISVGAFRGIGKTLPPSLTTGVVNVLRIPLVYFLSKTSLGLDGLWIGVTLGSGIRSLAIFIWYLVYASKQPKTDVGIPAVTL